ncbi:hypothetical protein GH714_017678 [Hevea brasiliensis]|uniref:RRM domain-containing protein n=1 Tax=Hevea brasiliensis TaxID=3981 RepID=A0A6A6L802_HEVBR|nr:hypothetical protein GH714_017678 [Hevea brasiliensis]
MSGNTSSTVYVGNLDERVSDRVLYDILIQAGRVVDLYVPRDKETDRPKGYAFAEYETEEIAEYAVKLFSGLVILYNRTLKFAISGQDKPSQNPPSGSMSATNSSNRPRPYPVPMNNVDISNQSMSASSPGVTHHHNGYGSQFNGINYNSGRRVFGSTFDSISRSRSRRMIRVTIHHTPLIDSIKLF